MGFIDCRIVVEREGVRNQRLVALAGEGDN